MAKRTFENALSRLEKITEELESGELTLDASLKKFNEGVELADFCNTELNAARAKVELLVKKEEGLESVPFDDEHGHQNLSD